jgi:2'-5' RNA ligase
MPRLFIAIDLPEQVKTLLGRLRVDIPGARWVPAEQLHLTLAFLGDQDAETAARLKTELAVIQAPGFTLRFSQPGCFPRSSHPRVLWIGLEPEPRLTRLAALLREALLSSGIPLEDRPFTPHITLARLKLPAAREVAAFLDQRHHQEIPAVEVGKYVLFESRLTPKGAVHTVLEIFPLSSGKPVGQE